MEASIRRELSSAQRLGIMGGTFDPIHYGHLVAAETARVELGLDYVLFIPTGESPHKSNLKITDAEMRFKMVEISIKNNKYFKASRIEIKRKGPSYTVDTLREIHKLLPKQEIFFITGTDAMIDILAWREPQEIFKLARVIGASRPGYESQKHLAKIFSQYPESKDRLYQLEIPALAISSTYIRSRVGNNKSVRYLLPDEVRMYIENNRLYC
ncbi:MAG: nicotinate-nucleotide adenylyltransferase [Peptococcaceae bacterium]|jgi:nicotinate-nucleotide adenylyltransferase|nr:nicotinate-nucleotide adenylyltransferase [Peptococcaceae bacterium]